MGNGEWGKPDTASARYSGYALVVDLKPLAGQSGFHGHVDGVAGDSYGPEATVDVDHGAAGGEPGVRVVGRGEFHDLIRNVLALGLRLGLVGDMEPAGARVSNQMKFVDGHQPLVIAPRVERVAGDGCQVTAPTRIGVGRELDHRFDREA